MADTGSSTGSRKGCQSFMQYWKQQYLLANSKQIANVLYFYLKNLLQETACFSRDAQNNFSRYNCNYYRLC